MQDAPTEVGPLTCEVPTSPCLGTLEGPGAIALIAVSRPGSTLAMRLGEALPDAHVYLPAVSAGEPPESGATPATGGRGGQNRVRSWQPPLRDLVGRVFPAYRSIVFFGSVGMVVRLIAPLLDDKRTDPAVVVVDDGGRFAVSVLSGHVGGANALAERVADLLGALPVVTTGSDVLGTPAVDLLGREFGWRIENPEALTRVSAAVVNGEPVGVLQEAGEPDWWPAGRPLPESIRRYDSLGTLLESRCSAALLIRDRLIGQPLPFPAAVYRPRSLVVGVGCNRGTDAEEVEQAIQATLREHRLSPLSLCALATIDLKRDEAGLRECAEKLGIPIRYYGADELASAPGVPNPSAMVERHVGAPSVCEAAALLASGATSLLVPKAKTRNVTVAVARKQYAAQEE